MHKTSISFTHRIIEYLNSIAGRYALAVPSRKTAVKLVTGPLSLPEKNHPHAAPARLLRRFLRREPPLTAMNPWKVPQEYFAPVAPWEHVGDTFDEETESVYNRRIVSLISPLTVSTFAYLYGHTGTYHRLHISIIDIYSPRLFSRAAAINGYVNGIPIFSTFLIKDALANRY